MEPVALWENCISHCSLISEDADCVHYWHGSGTQRRPLCCCMWFYLGAQLWMLKGSQAVIGPIDTDGAETRWGSLGHNQHTNTTAILRSTCSPYSTLWARARLQGYTAVWNKASALRDTFLVWSTPLMPTCPQLKLCKIS